MGKKPKFVMHEDPSEDEEEDFSDGEGEFETDDEAGMEGVSADPNEEDVDSDGGGAAQPAAQPRKKKGSQRPEREPIYDTEGLHEKLEDIGWDEGGMVWDDTQVITHDDPTQIDNVDDDISRELTFYQQALSAAQQAIVRFNAAGTPWLRPPDYYAEMVKSDVHMAKVKEQLMHEQRLIEQTEERRKAREAKQYSKQVQAERVKERAASKKQQIEGLSKLRKQREKTGYAGNMDVEAELAAMQKGAPGGGRQQGGGFRDRGGPQKGPVSKKRAARDSKYGYGGSKKLKKQNDAYSVAAVDSFKQGRFTESFAGGKGGGGGGGGGGKSPAGRGGKGGRGGGKGGPGGVRKPQMKRPGKAARAQNASKKGGRR